MLFEVQDKQDRNEDVAVKNKDLPITPGTKIGLFGGSFNPAHEWHFQISKNALTSLKLDKIIWLVSSENPLKNKDTLMKFDERFLSAQKLAESKYFFVSSYEKENKTKYSIDTVSKIITSYPDTKFIWIMGSDCAADISNWKDWEKFINLIPIAIYPRPSYAVDSKKLDLIKENTKLINNDRQSNFINEKPPVITFIPGPMSDISSTQIREKENG